MRGLIVVVAVVGCSNHRREPGAGSAQLVPPPPPKAAVTHPTDRLVERGVCVAPGAWAGKWDGARPLDDANPFAHRGPTRVTITDKLHLSEGVGAAGYQVDLVVDGNVAYAEKTSTKTRTAMALETGARSELTITEGVAVAACFDAQGALHLWRILDASGQGIQTTHEEDAVVLQRVPMRPPPPPPKGFIVLAEDDHPFRIALTPTEVIWSTADDGMPAMSAIRAVPRKGGAMRELASGIPFIHDLVVRGDYVYFAGQEAVGRVPLAGGKVETLVDGVTAMNLALDDKTLAFGDLETVQVVPVAGGKPRAIYAAKDADIAALAIDGGALYVAVRPMSLEQPGTLERVSPASGAATRLAKITVCGDDIVTTGGGSLLVGTCEGTIMRIGEQGGVSQVAKELQDVAGIAVSGGTVVYALGAGRGIIGAVTGGKPRTLVEGEFDPEQLVIDPAEPKTVYVLDRGIDLDNPHGRIGTVAL